jgi:hypothetical protein
VDQDCDAADLIDIDNDGWGAGQWGYDCDDLNPEAWPGAPERWYDGVDQSCNGGDDFDADRDGYPTPEDCDDADEATHPGAVDLPEDGVDQDCGGEPESLPTDDIPAVNPVTPWGCATASGSGQLPLYLAIFSLLRRPRQQHRPPREDPKLPARQRSAGRHQEAARRQ